MKKLYLGSFENEEFVAFIELKNGHNVIVISILGFGSSGLEDLEDLDTEESLMRTYNKEEANELWRTYRGDGFKILEDSKWAASVVSTAIVDSLGLNDQWTINSMIKSQNKDENEILVEEIEKVEKQLQSVTGLRKTDLGSFSKTPQELANETSSKPTRKRVKKPKQSPDLIWPVVDRNGKTIRHEKISSAGLEAAENTREEIDARIITEMDSMTQMDGHILDDFIEKPKPLVSQIIKEFQKNNSRLYQDSSTVDDGAQSGIRAATNKDLRIGLSQRVSAARSENSALLSNPRTPEYSDADLKEIQAIEEKTKELLIALEKKPQKQQPRETPRWEKFPGSEDIPDAPDCWIQPMNEEEMEAFFNDPDNSIGEFPLDPDCKFDADEL